MADPAQPQQITYTDEAVIRLCSSPWHMDIGGRVDNLALYRLMLLEALRVVETQLRITEAKAASAGVLFAGHLPGAGRH